MNIGVLASGGGTNVQALIDAAARGDLGPGRLAVVGTNIPGCGALARAQEAAIPTFTLDHRPFGSRGEFDLALVGELRRHHVDLVVLAGFMRLLTINFLDAFPMRVINIHPALLPAFPGVHGQDQAFAYGVTVAGCTAHFVDGGTDTGPIIGQAVVPILADDTAETLHARILIEEHRLLPAAVRAVAEGRVVPHTGSARRMRVTGTPLPTGWLQTTRWLSRR